LVAGLDLIPITQLLGKPYAGWMFRWGLTLPFPDCPRWRLGYTLPGFQGFIDQDPRHHGNRPLFLFGKRLKLPHCFIIKSKGNRI